MQPLPLLAPHMSEDLFPEPEIALSPMPLCEHVAEDYVATGLSLKEHPISFFREQLARLGAMRNAELRSEALPQDRRITVAGLVLMRQMPGRQGRGLHDARGRDRHCQHHRLAESVRQEPPHGDDLALSRRARTPAARGPRGPCAGGEVSSTSAPNCLACMATISCPICRCSRAATFIEPSAAQPPGSVPIRASASSLRAYWLMYQPPLGETTWPVMNFASSLAR